MSKEKNKNKISKEKSRFNFIKSFEFILFVVSFLLFSNTIRNGYCLDDELVTEKNRIISKGLGGIKKIFTSYYTEGSDQKYNYEYRPIPKVTFALEYALVGFKPSISHFINVLLYSIGIIILYKLLLLIFSETYALFSFLCCLLYAVHPIHTEVVASLKNRDELLAFLFGISSMYLLIKIWKPDSAFSIQEKYSKKIVLTLLGIVLLILAIFSKKDAILFFGLIPLGFFVSPKGNRLVYLILSFTIVTVFFSQKFLRNILLEKEQYVREFKFQENPLYFPHAWQETIAIVGKSFLFYFKIFFFPYPLRFYYGFNQISQESGFVIEVFVSIIIVSVLLYFAFKTFKTQTYIFTGSIWFLIATFPFLNILTPAVGIVAERFAFISSVGLSILFVGFLSLIFKIDWKGMSIVKLKNTKSGFFISMILIIIIFTGYSFKRNSNWQDRFTLYATDIKHLTNSAKANEMMASAYYAKAQNEKSFPYLKIYADSAIYFYERALEIYPNYFTVQNNLGSLYFNLLGDSKKPIPYFKKALELDSSYVPAMQNLAMCYLSNADTINSLYYLNLSLKKDSYESPKVLITASIIYHRLKNYKRSDEYLNQAKMKFPNSDLPHIQHSNFLLSQGDTLNSMKELQHAVDKNTQFKNVYLFLVQQRSEEHTSELQSH